MAANGIEVLIIMPLTSSEEERRHRRGHERKPGRPGEFSDG